jgi:multidrug efflux pump subunit AcrA (membrane-fusion protein)
MATSENTMGDMPHPRGHSPKLWLLFLLLVLIVAALVVFFGVLPREKVRAGIDQQAKQRVDSHPRVQVVRVEPAPARTQLVVPGTTLAYTEAYIYARASGYVTRRLVDIGDHVHKGQLLAVIDSPDLDQQVAQARSGVLQSQSTLEQLQAQLILNTANWNRYKVLVQKGVFSKQDGDTQEANYRSADANVHAAQNAVQANKDNLQRLLVLQQYEKVTAPFSGVITARNVDVGALISAQGTGMGSGGSNQPGDPQSAASSPNAGASGAIASSVAPATGGAQGGQMFGIASLDALRILVAVPEAYAPMISLGQKAELDFQALPGQKVMGTVSRTSASIDQNSRTLLVEVHVSNPNQKLLPGMYVVVNFIQIQSTPPLVVPGEAIVVRNAQSAVAVVADNHVHFKSITIGRDFGEVTEVTSGVQPGDLVVKNVSDEVQEGAAVEPILPKAAPKKGQ